MKRNIFGRGQRLKTAKIEQCLPAVDCFYGLAMPAVKQERKAFKRRSLPGSTPVTALADGFRKYMLPICYLLDLFRLTSGFYSIPAILNWPERILL